MKQLKFSLLAFMALFLSGFMVGCSDDDEPSQPDDPTLLQDFHFDLWVALDRHGGMGRDVQTLVRSLDNLDADQPAISFVGTGTEVNSILSLETIVKGEYYYQVPVSQDRFSKYIIQDNQVKAVAERRFLTNSYACRKYTHAWIDDNTLVIMAASGDTKSIIWTKLNAADMTILAEGTLDLPLPPNSNVFTTSGILTYRQADNRLFYFYYGKGKVAGGKNTRTSPFYTAAINPASMTVESNTSCAVDCEMVGSAYGELLQKATFQTESGDLYLACYGDTESGEKSYLLRIPAGSTAFDAQYNGFPNDGKLLSVEYLGGNQVMAYVRDDSVGTGIDSFSHYYTVINLQSSTSAPVQYNGARLDYSSGRFSSRMAVVNHKAYIGVDAEGKNPQIYIYDAQTGQTSLGASMLPGYYFEQIRVVENVK